MKGKTHARTHTDCKHIETYRDCKQIDKSKPENISMTRTSLLIPSSGETSRIKCLKGLSAQITQKVVD